jgi:hypothetical protein
MSYPLHQPLIVNHDVSPDGTPRIICQQPPLAGMRAVRFAFDPCSFIRLAANTALLRQGLPARWNFGASGQRL